MPYANPDQNLAEHFADFFLYKITKIWNELDHYALYESRNRDGLTTLIMLNPASDDIVKKFMKEMKCISCQLDLIPTKLIKEHLDKFASLLSLIVNKPLYEACFQTDGR